MRLVRGRALLASAAVLARAVAAGCGGGGGSGGGGGAQAGQAVQTNTCSSPTGKGQFTIVSDFPLQGSSKLQTDQMNDAIKLVFEQHHYKAGKYTVQFQT